MRRPVVTIGAHVSVREAAALMRGRGIRHLPARVMRGRRLGALPVVDAAGRVVGMLTERDLLDALQAVLRQRVVRPSPTPGEPGSTYDTGVEPPPDADPGWDSGALD